MGLCKLAQAAFSSWDICQQLIAFRALYSFRRGTI